MHRTIYPGVLTMVLRACGGVWLALTAIGAHADAAASVCETLTSADFSIVQDAPTHVIAATLLAADGDMPDRCRINGYVAPQIQFLLTLPAAKSAWNGKFIEIGTGGWTGALNERIQQQCDDAVSRGYACIHSDHGHTSALPDSPTNSGLWAWNDLQAEIDYGFRALHAVALAGKAVTHHFYGTAPKFSYFMGCSGGGRQGMVAAQRFPWDFDGIVSMDPAINLTGVVTALMWNIVAVTDERGGALFDENAIDLLHRAAVEKCDMTDGAKDGVIGDPRACKFDPAVLACRGGQKSGCLSAAQAAAARKVYSGPVTSKGEEIFPGRTMPGTEKGVFSFGLAEQQRRELWSDFFRYMAFVPDPGPSWQSRDLDFDADYKRLGMMESIYAATNPDLRRFKAKGGRLLIVQGWDDSGSPLPLNTIDYYETVEKTMGGREATQEFARLFMAPGRAHCIAGDGAHAADFLGHLEAWVERDRAPTVIKAFHIADSENAADYWRAPKDPGKVKFTRPLYPYPLEARYKGRGDPNDWQSFEPTAAPADWNALKQWQRQLSAP